MIPPTILLVEDEPAQREMLAYNLEAEGFDVITADNGEDGLLMVEENNPDLIVLDWMMPELSGVDVCRKVRELEHGRSIYIVLLTAKNQREDLLEGLEAGADDYVTKPYNPRELILRVKALLKRIFHFQDNPGASEYIQVGPLSIDLSRHEVQIDGQVVELTLTISKHVVDERIVRQVMEHPLRIGETTVSLYVVANLTG